MNTRYHLTAVCALVIVGIVMMGAGCAKMRGETGIERAEQTTASMQTVNSDISQASLQIDAVKASLDHLLKTGQSQAALPDDVKVAYTTFSENAEKMKNAGRKLNKDIDEMASAGNAYFQEWAKEGGTYTDPQIQKLSENRRARLNSTFREMQSATASVRANLNSYLSDLGQIQTYLSNDLTPKGIAAIASIAQAVERDGNKLKQSFGPVETAIMQARAELTPGSGGEAAGGVPGTKQQPDKQKRNDSESPK